MFMQAVLFLVRVLGISVGVYYQDFMLGVIWFSILNVFGYLVYQVVAFKSIGLEITDVLAGYIFALPVVFLVLFIEKQYSIPWSGHFFVVGVIFSIFYYYKIMVSFNND